jgi:hypothetical protein
MDGMKEMTLKIKPEVVKKMPTKLTAVTAAKIRMKANKVLGK